MGLDNVLAVLREHLPALREEYRVKSLAVFGSVVRDEATDQSDVDILVEFDSPPTFSLFMGLKERLEVILGIPVDLATPAALKPRIRPRVEREAVHVA